ncbi:DUF342 domain-containing protein [Marinospirillum alkaliphilum]|uniref:Flagellar Assembly Protein A N-terminal region domain-containing protein n=1 Tax=Marinospirillum alkaliphilum DSM 21637 TaxID=1122209 RepID=A0A1K1VX40_9GAMM|nr:FapA family protein [Marinospirillum alkaliphilum]SFX29726.1 hypothetical protein SAMN02745752_01130 [Marinospirillum alkaliphilum DSM 21637]
MLAIKATNSSKENRHLIPEAANEPVIKPSALDLGISYHLRNDNELWADFTPVQSSIELKPLDFAQLTLEAGYPPDDFPLLPSAVAVLLDAMRRGEGREACISLPVDAELEIHLSENKLVAGAVLRGSHGRGKPLDRARLEELIRKHKITRGLLDDVVETLTSADLNGKLHNTENSYSTVLAYGETPVDGQHARIEPLVEGASDRRLFTDHYDRVDYFDRGDFPFVAAGTPLIRRHPPTKGKPGWTVTGKTLRARDGKDIQLKLKDASVCLDEQDPDLLLAAVDGMPVIHDKGAQVEQVLRLPRVDLSTGHVRYKGSVEISGEVLDGMQVIASGDIRVQGTVDAAFLKAGGHIELATGAIGNKDAQYLTEKARLKATCSIRARFVHEALLEAGQEIVIGSHVSQSKLTAGTFIQVEGKGQVTGSQLIATDLIEINTSGALAFSKTELRVGDCRQAEEEYTQLLRKQTQLDRNKYKLVELARDARHKGAEKLERMKPMLLKAKQSLQLHQRLLDQRREQVQADLKRAFAAKVVINRRAYPGTSVIIAGRKQEINRESEQLTFALVEGKITVI